MVESAALAALDKEITRTRSWCKDALDVVFRELVFKRRVRFDTGIPLVGQHELSFSEKQRILQFLLEAVDELEPFELLVLRRRLDIAHSGS